MISLNRWLNEGVLGEDTFSTKSNKIESDRSIKNLYIVKDVSDNDSFIDILLFECHGEFEYEKFEDAYKRIVDIRNDYQADKDLNQLKIFISFKNWEAERKIIQKLQSEKKTAIRKKEIERDFSEFNSVYFPLNKSVELKIDEEGINYLTSPEGIEETELKGLVVNCSFYEMKKLFNVTGVKLFRSNVREGITDNKSQIKAIVKNYLSLDESDNTSNISEEYNDYDPSLFWFSHNGVTLFVNNSSNSNFNFRHDTLTINPKSCSVINGAQTITNFFLAYSELEYKYRYEDKSDDKIRKLEDKIKNIFVKLTVINGKKKYSPFITRGLNTQNPISEEDFVAISNEVQDLNKVSEGYFYILKAGEAEIKGGLSPLQFVKNFLIVDSKPGKSKNFNKKNIETEIKQIHKQLVTEDISNDNRRVVLKDASDNRIKFEKMTFLFYIEEWWKKKNRKIGNNKDLIDKYGKNYFQSYCLLSFEDLNSTEDISIKISDLYDEFRKLIRHLDPQIDINIFKDDKLFDKILEKYKFKDESIQKEKIDFPDNYFDELKERLKDSRIGLWSFLIKKFNKEENIYLDRLRVVIRINGKLRETFFLSSETFSSIYQEINIEEKLQKLEDLKLSDFKEFEQSILFKELKSGYNLYIIDIDDKKRIDHITLLRDFDFNLISSDELHKAYDSTVKAFIEGNPYLLPNIRTHKVYLRQKGIRKDDSFLFSNGEQMTRRTFCISSSYINNLLNSRLR
ncbi:hypothetical protein [Streptococcus salivarius]|uniref:hypothetical protein n=1 Tax=Streptococcus salivarius TaxID=1304 RepID=UPI0034A19365